MYYALIVCSVLLTSCRMAMGDVYRRMRGDNLVISLEYSWLGALAGILFLFPMNGFRVEYTHFTLAASLASAVLNLSFMFCSFRALGIINLSLYSVFAMLGSLVLPFLTGILFYEEPLTLGKSICLVCICFALFFTVDRSEKRKGTIYYIGIFLINGIYGMLNKFYAATTMEKASSTGYILMTCLWMLVLAPSIIVFLKNKTYTKPSLRSLGLGLFSGSFAQLSNLLLVIALGHVDASVQYPMVTGGIMIISTLYCFFTPQKPSKKELLSVATAFFGLLAMFLIPV